MDVKFIRFAAAGDQIFCRRRVGRSGEKRDQDGVVPLRPERGEWAIIRDLSQLGGGAEEGRDLEAESSLQLALDPGAEPRFVPRARLENDVAARDQRLNAGKSEQLKLAPQPLHFHGPPADIDCAEKSEEGGHILPPPNDDGRRCVVRPPGNHFDADPNRVAHR